VLHNIQVYKKWLVLWKGLKDCWLHSFTCLYVFY
jgi:hypothetical protein